MLNDMTENNSNFYNPSFILESRNEILELINNNKLTVFFQPIYSAANGFVLGYEALTRISGLKNYPIENLFEKAIASKTISALELKIREIAISKISSQDQEISKKLLFLNLSPEVLLDPSHNIGFTDRLTKFYGISREQIIFEITEESAIKNFDLFKQSVTYYKKRGYKIAIDDFGSGYAGLKMLSIIEPDFIKIDRHFISSIDKDKIKKNIVDAIIRLAHKMGISIVAEGIEKEEELKTVINLKVDLLQGFLLFKPSYEFQKKPFKLNKNINDINLDTSQFT